MAAYTHGYTFASPWMIQNTVTTSTATGSTRWNQTNNQFEMFDGSNWVVVTDGLVTQETLADSILHAQDTIESYIEEDHKDNPTIQDAYAEWVAATEKFRVIAGLAEK